MATSTKTKGKNKGKTAAKVAPPTPIDQGGPEAAQKAAEQAAAEAKAAAIAEATTAEDKPKRKPAAPKDVEALNTRGVYGTSRKSLDPPTYVTHNGRWMEVKCAEPMTAGDQRHSPKTPWALIQLADANGALKEPKLIDYVRDSDTALKVAVFLDDKSEELPEKHPNIRPTGYKAPAEEPKASKKEAAKTS